MMLQQLFVIFNRMLTAGECAQLRTGRCTLSHWPSPTRLPVCTEFCERGSCAASAASASASASAGVSATSSSSAGGRCPLRHVLYPPGARTCPRFARYGYCPRGASVHHHPFTYYHYYFCYTSSKIVFYCS